jgi:hypothetical protein
MMGEIIRCVFLLIIFSVTAAAQSRPAIFLAGDDCDKGVATQAVVYSFRNSMAGSKRWSEGNDKVPQTPEVYIQCWNVDGESFVVSSFGFTLSGEKAVYDKPKMWLPRTPDEGRELGKKLFKLWEDYWYEPK